MPTRVELDPAVAGHAIPERLAALGAFVRTREHGDLGWFDAMLAAPIPSGWSEAHADRLRAAGFAFLQLPDGSLLALLSLPACAPVVLLDADGEARTIAESVGGFAHAWARGETGIPELDDSRQPAREALAAWLAAQGMDDPDAAGFDVQAWLDGDDGHATASSAAAPSRAPTNAMAQLGPTLRQAAGLVGRRLDDPELTAFITDTLGKKSPPGTTEARVYLWVEAPKKGLNLLFSHEVRNAAYPPVAKTAKAFVPYLQQITVSQACGETALDVPWDVSGRGDVEAVLGPPSLVRPRSMIDDVPTVPHWIRPLDEGADVDLTIALRRGLDVTLAVRTARELASHLSVGTAVFVAWAAIRNLLDPERFGEYAEVLGQVERRQAHGSALRAALDRGLWDEHLVDRPGLRRRAYQWFHNIGGSWITDDLIEAFGARKGPHGHDEPALDEDSWDAVDRIAGTFDERFAKWLA